LNYKVEDIQDLKEQVVIICNAYAAKNYQQLSWLSMDPVRGQISHVTPNEDTKNLKCNLHYTNDRFPVVGPVPEISNVYLSAAFGSHGIVGSLAAAHYLADLIRQGPRSLPKKSAKALMPQRFLDRQRRKNK